MKIKKSSWHYKFHSNFNPEVISDLHCGRISLCSYFWKTIGTSSALGFAVIFTSFLLAVMLLAPIVLILHYTIDLTVPFNGIQAMWAGIIFDALIAGLILNHYFKLYEKKSWYRNSLVYNYISTKKSKFCPMIEIDEEC